MNNLLISSCRRNALLWFWALFISHCIVIQIAFPLPVPVEEIPSNNNLYSLTTDYSLLILHPWRGCFWLNGSPLHVIMSLMSTISLFTKICIVVYQDQDTCYGWALVWVEHCKRRTPFDNCFSRRFTDSIITQPLPRRIANYHAFW